MSFTIAVFISMQLIAQSVKDSLSSKTYKELNTLISVQLPLDGEVASNVARYYIEKAKKEQNVKEEFKGLDNFIQVAIWSRKFDSFDNEYRRLLAIAEANKFDKELMLSLYEQGNAYFFQGVWSKTTEPYYKSLELAKSLKDLKFEHIILTQLGYMKSTIGDSKSALKFQHEALLLIQNAPIDSVITAETQRKRELRSLFFISISYINAKEIDSARLFNARALKLNEKLKDSCLMRSIFKQRSEIEILSNRFDYALKDLEISKTYCLPLTSLDSLIISTLYGKAYLGLRNYKKAVEVLQSGLDNYPVKGPEEGFMDDHYKVLAKAYKYVGDVEKSNLYFEKYIFTTDEFNKIQDTLVSDFKQKDIAAFKKELDAIKIEKNQQQNYVLYLALGSTLVILTLLFFLLKFYQNKKKNDLKFQELLLKLKLTEENATIKVIDTKDEVLEETTTSDVSEEVTQQILDGLQKLESQEYFLNQDCNAYNVAKKIKTNTSYLSKVVNAHFQKNFNTYINDLRINYAIVRLKNDTRFRLFSIQSIAEELGYKSADSFTKYFKQDTGLNPSFYIKQLNQLS